MNSQMFKRTIQTLLIVGSLAAFWGCNGDVVYVPVNNGGGGGGGGGGPIVTVPQPVTYAWFDVFGGGCATASQGPRPGCNFYWYSTKLVKIIDQEDPYFNSTYTDPVTGVTTHLYNLTWDHYVYSLNGTTYAFDGPAWVSPNGLIYNEYGNALNQKKGHGRDLVGDVAKAELNVVTSAGKAFAARYALSDAKGIEIAKTLNDWAKIGKDRVRSEQDISVFTQRLFGVPYSNVKNAVLEAQKGNQDAMNQAINTAAHSWGTNEEGMRQVLKNWFVGFDAIK